MHMNVQSDTTQQDLSLNPMSSLPRRRADILGVHAACHVADGRADGAQCHEGHT